MIGVLLFAGAFFTQEKAYAYGECSEYGIWATYDYLSGGCKCMSGYVFGKDSIGRTQCVSPDSICTDQLGYNARYNSLYDRCECRSGYVISGGRCTDGDIVCHAKHGLYSNYDDLSNSCECDSGYTFNDSNQCVEKQNNVYFTLKELDTDERRAIIKSDYDYRYYLISYNSGCYSSSFRRYLNHQIVVNLGTDFDLDTWDRIVLQDDDEVCDITRVERADSSTTLNPETEEETFYFVPQPSSITPPQPAKNVIPAPVVKTEFQFDETKKEKFENQISGEVNTNGALRKCPSTSNCDVLRYLNPKTKINIIGGYNNGEWFQVNIIGAEPVSSGWMHSSIVSKIASKEAEQQSVNQSVVNGEDPKTESTDGEQQQNEPWYKKIFGFLSRLFR